MRSRIPRSLTPEGHSSDDTTQRGTVPEELSNPDEARRWRSGVSLSLSLRVDFLVGFSIF